ncbi:hypothetical protein S7711_05637 [Stachybotrys chartarum IBT 7711]|uniref:Ubiquitin-like domain-containing protein n=1 Tax=Stachybotrys chartarum (strain CBS 109288 / IBT 7711) TaxID=1280523 RepID=A0A084B4T8_STACB|nr:hypothetical protein S7711_05637 [Stachybotrys chartarum IBT 7711]
MSEDVAAPAPRRKKLPFKPTALRKDTPKKDPPPGVADAKRQGGDEDDDGLELFRRAREMAPIMAQDRERRLLKKQKQEAKVEERRLSGAGEKRPLVDEEEDGGVADAPTDTTLDAESAQAVEDDTDTLDEPLMTAASHHDNAKVIVTPPPSKRIKHDQHSSPLRPSSSMEEAEDVYHSSPSRRATLVRPYVPSPGSRSAAPPGPTAKPAVVITLDSDDDVEASVPLPSATDNVPDSVEVLERRSSSLAEPANPPDEDEDPEFAEYERMAEEQRLYAGNEVVEVLISSAVPDCSKTLMRIKYNQPLKLVRDTWLAQQVRKGARIAPDQHDDVLLTWRRRRIYNASTLLSLGIRPRRDGRVAVEGYSRDGLSSSQTRIHMEAWTTDLFRDMQRDEDLRRRREAGEIPDEDEPEEPAPEAVKLKVILQARDMPPFNLTVHQETTVETLVTSFRKSREVPPDRDVGLSLDGDRLEEHITMADAGIEDMDTIDVFIK